MSQKAKDLLKRLKKERKPVKQIDLINELKDYNQEDIVTHVLLVHLQRKDHISVRLEILNTLNYNDDKILDPLIDILNDEEEPLPVKEKVIKLLGQNGSKKARKALLKAFRKSKDPKLTDNLAYALTFFDDKRVIKNLIKSLKDEELRLHVLSGLARNESTVFSSLDLIKAIITLKVTKQFELLHYDRIVQSLLDKYGFKNLEEIMTAIKEKRLEEAIEQHIREKKEIEKTLDKVKM